MTDQPELLPEGDPQILAKLLRAIAGGTDAQASKHDIIFLTAAYWLDHWNTRPTPAERPSDLAAMNPATTMTRKAWMELYGTPAAPKPEETGWNGFSHPTRKQWAQLWADANSKAGPVTARLSDAAAVHANLIEMLRHLAAGYSGPVNETCAKAADVILALCAIPHEEAVREDRREKSDG